MDWQRLTTIFTGNEKDWTFVGSPDWRDDEEWIIYPPVWSNPEFDRDRTRIPNLYAYNMAHEDFAFLTSQPLADTDISVDYKCPYGAAVLGSVVFRAVDSSQFYVVEVNDMGRKGHYYELTLCVQDENGYRRELARGKAPHSVVPERIVQGKLGSRQEWDHSSPDWVRVRVQASGTFVRVTLDDQVVLETRDSSYPVGCVGLVARGPIRFRNLSVEGCPQELPKPWTVREGRRPPFFHPGEQADGFHAYPASCRTDDGLTLVAWTHAPRPEGYADGMLPADRTVDTCLVLSRSEDEGRTWSGPERMFSREGHECGCTSLFAHRDGALSCVLHTTRFSKGSAPVRETLVIRSGDGGESWSEGEEFAIAGKPISSYGEDGGHLGLYSPMVRLSDGSVVMCGYEVRIVPGGDIGVNADRRDRSVLLRSSDDGYTWNEMTYFDENNFDQNECMVAESEPGKLFAFMRTLQAPTMWQSFSEDGGRTWSALTQSGVSGECPYLLGHSSGTLILSCRGCGTQLRLSSDGGASWIGPFRVSPASAMVGMTEMSDGRVLIVMHEGYMVPGHIRGHFFRVTPEGPVPAE